MDTRDGRIYPLDEETAERFRQLAKVTSALFSPEFLMPMLVPPTEKQMARRPPRVGRNEPCPCGSGKKFKKCCLNR